MNKNTIAYIQLHIAVMLYGLTAILGDLISISAISLVWWRVLLTSISLLFFIGFGRQLFRLSKSTIITFLAIGIIVALHWICFYGSIKLANASIALITMATTSFFTSLIEPSLLKTRFNKLEVFIGILIVPGMALIVKDLDVENINGFLVGLLSAFLASLFASLNKKFVDKANAFQISFLEMFSAFLFISLLLPVLVSKNISIMPVASDWIYLIILALACTTLAFVITMKALKIVSAFDANLVINLEPVYGIVLAAIILKEHKELNTTFYIGALFIISIVLIHPILKRYVSKQKLS